MIPGLPLPHDTRRVYLFIGAFPDLVWLANTHFHSLCRPTIADLRIRDYLYAVRGIPCFEYRTDAASSCQEQDDFKAGTDLRLRTPIETVFPKAIGPSRWFLN
jgi:hypothetical protein